MIDFAILFALEWNHSCKCGKIANISFNLQTNAAVD